MPNHPNPFTASPFAPKPPVYGSVKASAPVSGVRAGGNVPKLPNGGPVPVQTPPPPPPMPAGGGTSSGGSAGGTTPGSNVAPPTITKAYAAQDGSGTSSLFTVTGSGLSGAKVEIDGIAATVTQQNSSVLNGKIPAGVDTGMVPITVTTGAGSSSATITITVPRPSITSISPSSGDVSGTRITISGTGLAGASSVIIGGAQADIVGNTATSIVAEVPAASAIGSVTLTVQTGAGSASKSFTVTEASVTPPPGTPPPFDPTTPAGWLAAIEVPGSAAQTMAYNAISTTGGVGLSLAELSTNVSMIAGELGTNTTAASILAALASLGSTYLSAAAPGATFTPAQVFAAGNVSAGAQASLASEYNAAIDISTTPAPPPPNNGTGGGGPATPPSAVDPATGQYYAYETDPSTGLPYVIDPATGIPYSLEQTGIQGSNPGLPTAATTSSNTPLILLGLGALAAFYFYEQKQKSQAATATPAASP